MSPEEEFKRFDEKLAHDLRVIDRLCKWFVVFAVLAVVCYMLTGCGGGGGAGGSGEPPNVLVAAQSSPPVATPAVPASTGVPAAGGCTIGYWGDSISGLTGWRIDPRIVVDMHAVWGGTAQAAVATFLQDPLAEPIQVIEYGTNDADAKVDPTGALTAMLDRAKALGRTVVLTGMPHNTAGDPSAHATVDAIIRALAKAYGAAYADWPDVPYAAGDLIADGVHPGDAYQQRLADVLSSTVLSICTK